MGASQKLAAVVAIGLVTVATFSIVYLFNEPHRREASQEFKTEESALRGADTYVDNCLSCHGEDGMATGRQGVPLNTAANQVTGAEWDLREPELRRKIERGGVAGSAMPAWALADDGPLNDEQISDLMNLIHLGLWEDVAKKAVIAGGGQAPTPPPMPTSSAPTPDNPDAAAGQQLAQQNACLGCHTVDGSAGAGPTWQGLFGHEVTLADGTTVTADEEYITTSVRDPQAQVVQGFQPSMPPYGEGQLSNDDLAKIIEYIKSLAP